MECLTELVSLIRRRPAPVNILGINGFLEREKGFEPSTFSLARRRSTPEPLPLAPPDRIILYTTQWNCGYTLLL